MHSQMGLAHFWSQGDLITHTTALILGLLSVGSWSVILTKLLSAWRASRSQGRALAARPAAVHGGGVLLPVPFPQTGLHVLRAGVFVGSVQKGRFIPEHHLFTAFGARCTNREELTLADPRVTDYLSGREMAASTAADGWCCVTVDGYPLGGGKVSAGRVKNHYPKALRLL